MFKKNHASAAQGSWVDASTFLGQQPHEIAAPAASQPTSGQPPGEIQALADQLHWCAEQRRHAARVFHWSEDAEDVVGRDADVSRRIEAVMQRLKASGPCRPLAVPSRT